MAAMAENFILFDGVEICGFESFGYYLFALGQCIVSKRRLRGRSLTFDKEEAKMEVMCWLMMVSRTASSPQFIYSLSDRTMNILGH